MPIETAVLKSAPGIKRDGTKFEGDNYTDGQWVRWQRGLPRKMGGYKTTQKFLQEISRGFSTFTQMQYVYCHSGGASTVERFTLDGTGNSSLITVRTPVEAPAYGTVTLAGASGSVDMIAVGGSNIMSGSVAFNSSLAQTAADVAANITAFTATTTIFAVTVANSGSGNKYYVGGVEQATVSLNQGRTYRFDQSAATNSGHPLRFSTSSNGTWAGGAEYTTGVTTVGVPGNAGAYTQITVPINAPTLYYYCTNHSGMGGQATTNVSAYSASSVGSVITITANTPGDQTNGIIITTTLTTLTSTIVNLNYGSDALLANPFNYWMFDVQYDSSTHQNYLIAAVSPNGTCVCNDQDGQIFFGEVLGTGDLSSIPLPPNANATGGIVSLHPYLFYYGTDGVIGWSVAGEPTNLTGAGSGLARVWGQKIIKGLPMRAGSGTAPAGIFWAFDAVLRATFTGGATVFQFDVIATGTSIMSQFCVVDYDGVFYWAGVDRFYMFNGVVREVPNSMNLDYFFDGINVNEQSKTFCFQVPKYGEIWWCYPRGTATECTHAVVYNVRENTWYDTELPNTGRSAGHFNNSFAAPVLAGVLNEGSGYKVWRHEFKVDEYDGPSIRPIISYFETSDLSTLVSGKNRYLRCTTIEPDFVQSGPMTVNVKGRANARAPEVISTTFTFPESAVEPYEQIVMLKEQRRELRVKIESNSLYGDYQMGQVIAHFDSGDGTDLG
jgi:hypothetical protein